MKWQEVCEDPNLQNLPYKIELNEHGKIILSPHKVLHSIFPGEIEKTPRMYLNHGKVFPECAIFTNKGTKIADVVWASDHRFKK